MHQFVAIAYSGFWDRPLAFVVNYRQFQFLFHREFDDERDNYQDQYTVSLLPHLSDAAIQAGWGHLQNYITYAIGHVFVKDVVFDPSFRKCIDATLLDTLIAEWSISSQS